MKKRRIERIYSFILMNLKIMYILKIYDINIKIYKLSLLGLFMNKILIQYLNEKEIFKNIKVINILILHFNKFIKYEILNSKLN